MVNGTGIGTTTFIKFSYPGVKQVNIMDVLHLGIDLQIKWPQGHAKDWMSEIIYSLMLIKSV